MRQLCDNEVTEHCKDLTILGYTHVPTFFDRPLVTELRDEIEALYLSGRHQKLAGGSIVPCVQNVAKRYIDLITCEPLERIVRASLNDPYYSEIPEGHSNYILSEYIARCTSGKLRMHIDSWIPMPGPRTYMMQLGIALDDRGEEDGCTVVVPGTHQSGQYTDRAYPNVKPLPLKAGDVVMWDSRLWHGTTEQKAPRRCWLLVATFQMWFVKPRFDCTKSLPAEIYERLESRQKAVLGFCSIPPSDPDEDQRSRKGYEVLPPAKR
jgi:hypothetical protein